jgi:hypothetical protein
MIFKIPSPTRQNPSTCPPLKAVTNPECTLEQHKNVTLVFVNTAILMPTYPAMMEVIEPVRYERAVYGKLVGALFMLISSRSTVQPSTIAKEHDQMVR